MEQVIKILHSKSVPWLAWPGDAGSQGINTNHGVNSSLPGENGRHFADNIFKCIFMKDMFNVLIQISLKFVPLGPIDNKSALVLVMAWRRPGGKPLPEPMLA